MCHFFCELIRDLQEAIHSNRKQEIQSFQWIHYCVAASAICWGREDSEAWSTARDSRIFIPLIFSMA